LSDGRPIGFYSVENGKAVWTRKVSLDRHLLRIRNAWTINRPILDQLQADGVEMVRYVSEAGTYEVGLEEFLEHAEVFSGFACGEDSLVLPRPDWTTHLSSSTEFLPLFVTEGT